MVKRGNWKRPCIDCGQTPSRAVKFPSHHTKGREYRASVCLKCVAKRQIVYRAKNDSKKDVSRRRENQYRWRYGMGRAELEGMLQGQNGKCAVCEVNIHFGFDAPYQPGGTKRNSTARVDHCHDTKKVRGVLCAPCNGGIGQLQDDPKIIKAALEYLLKVE